LTSPALLDPFAMTTLEHLHLLPGCWLVVFFSAR
jgi:hypothetical protein